ncbi:MAG: MalT-like region [Acidobacteriota bacterium]|jgi:tetratricopeptide (TPR) repeat protein|nr:MalT-like region [Acidobacteriota bacterium]
MTENHPARPVLERFVLGHLPAAEMRQVSQHLLAGCPECRQATAGLWERGRGGAAADPQLSASFPLVEDTVDRSACDEAIDRIFHIILARETVVARERAQGRELFEELARHPPARQLLMVSNSARFQSRMLCEILLEQAHEAGFREPARAVELARLGTAIADCLAERSGEKDGEGLQGLRARAWAQLGNALRISSDHDGAGQAFETATELLDPVRVTPHEIARVLDFEASLRRDQRRFAEATRLMDRVIAIYRKLGQRSLLGRSLQQKSLICGESGDSDGEIALLRRALELLNPEEEPRIFLAARHNLISALCESGRPREAFALLFHSRPLYLKQGDRLNLLRLRWVEGAVSRGLQRYEQAAVAFREVREAFLELGLDYDAALASLDLAEIYATQGRTADVRRLADEMLEVFRSRKIHREAMGALSVLQKAASTERAELVLIREVGSFFRQARNQPDLQFTPTS